MLQVGGLALQKVHDEKKLLARSKGETAEGAKEFVTKADLVSNHLILETLRRFPGLQVMQLSKGLWRTDKKSYMKNTE